MSQSGVHRSTYQSYPHLNKEEFAEVCHYLDRKYCQATLGPLRKQWRLSVHTALDMSFDAESEYTIFLQITRPLEDKAAAEQDLASMMGDFGISEDTTGTDEMMIEMEESDKETLTKEPLRPDPHIGHVKYEIHLHPTYRVPCLWFSLHNLPPDQPAFDTETVFRWLVPEQFRHSLQRAGSIGGISIDHHPVTGVPSFFLHPCVIGDAMASFDCPKEDYLMVWLGLVGGCVGLWVPKEMAIHR
ncbi:hypothetical protein F5B20DRAFT_163394 [Whalleya microplaca]|nr:hypothetical protein F5B20DRAFT_163394 [Whalleya microplaca]